MCNKATYDMSKPRNSLYALLTLALVLSSPIQPAAQNNLLFGDVDKGDQPTTDMVRTEAVFSYDEVAPGGAYPAALVVTIDSGWHINTDSPYQDWLIPADLQFDTLAHLTPYGIEYPAGEDITMADERITVWSHNTVIPFTIAVDSSAAHGDHVIPVTFTYQPCSDENCIPPETVELALNISVGDMGQAVNTDVFDRSQAAAASAKDTPEPEEPVAENDIQRLIDEYGFWGYFIALGLAFITGLLLSFSPCTYPMIPITVSIFAGQDRSVGKGFIMSLFYVGSMALVYGLMGMIVASVGGVFGAWLANPGVVIAIAIVFVIFSLSMFGLYELQVPMALRQKLGTKGGGGGVGGAILLGIVAALVVSPCVGPFVAGILLYIATSGSPLLGFVILFVFALGLGTLFVIIGTFSNAINRLPGAGGWMEQVKKFFGFVLLLMAIYFLRTIIPSSVVALLTGLLLLALAVFGGGFDRLTPESGFFARLKKFVGILSLLAAVYLLFGLMLSGGFIHPPVHHWWPGGGGSVAVEQAHIAWEEDLEAGLARAEREDKPVLIDTWATWCVNCRVLEKKTFGHPEVVAAADRFIPIKVQLEKANSPQTRDFMKRFGLKQYSLPTTLILDSGGRVRKVLPGVIGPDDMIEHMEQVH